MIQKRLLNIYENIETYNPNKKRKVLIVIDEPITEMRSNKNLNPIVTKLFIKGKKLNVSLFFIMKSFFCCYKNIILISKHYFVMKIPCKQKLQQIAFNHSTDIDFQEFMNLYKKWAAKPFFGY